MHPSTPFLLALSLVPKLGPVTARNLIAWCGGPREVFDAPRSKLLRIPGIGHKLVDNLNKKDLFIRADAILKQCEGLDITVTSYIAPSYPDMLKPLYDAPLVLYTRGKVAYHAQPAIAIVGTRKATDDGKALTAHFASYFAQRGINVVSGLAYGIDFQAHKAALKAGGISTAVLAHGLDMIYPGNHSQKAQELLERGGWISEYPPGSKIDPGNFPARNRIIAGLCRATVVIEAAEKGGALITGRFAFDQNREVYAVPGRLGDPFSKGCNALIRDQVAKLVVSPEEVLIDLGLDENPQTETKTQQLDLEFPDLNLPLNPRESSILNFLSRGESPMDGIAMNTNMSASELSAVLLGMEFRGLIRQMPGKRFKRL
ncbi:MAG: DNA-processing protein DprA [Bacteroidia bacterium]